MRSWRLLVLALVLVAPLAAAQPAMPTGNNQTAPSPSTGNNGSAVGPSESVEGAPGIVYGLLVLAGVLAFAGVLGYVSAQYRRGR